MTGLPCARIRLNVAILIEVGGPLDVPISCGDNGMAEHEKITRLKDCVRYVE